MANRAGIRHDGTETESESDAMRHLAALVIVIMAAAACSSDGDSSATEPSLSTSTASSTVPASTTSTTDAPTTTSVPVTTTTTTTVTPGTTTDRGNGDMATPSPRVFHMEWGPVDGQYILNDVPPSYGGVRPDAIVTLNGAPPAIKKYCGSWVRWEDMHCWGFGYTDEGVPKSDAALDIGVNVLAYEAAFEDGETLRTQLDVVYDPTLNASEGWLIDVVAGDPPLAVLAVVDIEPGEDDGIDVIGEPRQETLPIATDAAFIILENDTPGNRPSRVRTTDELLALIESVKAGDTPTFLFWGALLPVEDMFGGVPSTFLTNTDGELQQMEQWWSP